MTSTATHKVYRSRVTVEFELLHFANVRLACDTNATCAHRDGGGCFIARRPCDLDARRRLLQCVWKGGGGGGVTRHTFVFTQVATVSKKFLQC